MSDAVLADLGCYAQTVAPTLAQLAMEGRVAGGEYVSGGYTSPPYVGDGVGIDFTAAVDTSVSAAARPRSAADVQYVGMEVLDENGAIINDDLVQSITVRRQIGALSTASVVRRGTRIFPTRRSFTLGPPRTTPVSIRGLYKTSSGIHRIPLITGKYDNWNIQGGDQTGNIVDKGAYYDQKKVSLLLPPGHGLSRLEIIRRLAALAGISAPAASGGSPYYKQFQLANQEWLPVAYELGKVDLVEPYWERDGSFGLRPIAPSTASPVHWVFNEADVLADALGEPQASANINTEVTSKLTLTGIQQVLRAEEGSRAEITTVLGFSIYAPKRARKFQDLAGVLSTRYTDDGIASLILTSKVVTTKEYRGDTLLSERTTSWGWYNPVAARYAQNPADGSIASTHQFCYLYEPSAVANDGAQGYVWEVERFVKLSDVFTAYKYDDRGYQVGFTTTKHGWLQRKRATKSRGGAGTDWSAASWTSGTYLLADGTGVYDQQETWYGRNSDFDPPSWFAWEFTDRTPMVAFEDADFDVNDDQKIVEEVHKNYGFMARPGTLFQYKGGLETDDENETFILVGSSVTTNIDNVEGSHTVIEKTLDFNGRIVSMNETEARGSLPAAALDQSIIPADSLFTDEEQKAARRAASRYEQRAMRIVVNAPVSFDFDPAEEDVSVEYAGTPEDLQRVGLNELRNQISWDIHFTLTGANFLVDAGQMIHLRLRPLGIDHDLFVTGVSWTLQVGNPSSISCDIDARLFFF
jgi:hypothetical protein